MRRGSVVAPLILIFIGGIFLLRNIRPDLPILETVFNYWPFLLIAWGTLRAIEVLFLYFRNSALPRAGLGGGEWALIIFLTLFGSGAWTAQEFAHRNFGNIHIGGLEVFGESFDYTYDPVTRKAGTKPRIVVENLTGATRIIGTDSDEVKISGRKIVRAMDKTEADQTAQRTPLEMNSTGDVVTIRTNSDRASRRGMKADIEISVPRGSTIEAHGREVDFDVSDITGDVIVDSDNSGVRLQNIGGRVDVNTRASDIIRAIDVRGNIDLKGRGRDIELEKIDGQVTISGSYSGQTSLRNVNKPIRFDSSNSHIQAARVPGELTLSLSNLTANNVIGPVVVRSRSKDVEMNDITESLSIDVDNGDVEIRQSKAPVAKIDVQVRSGEIELAVPSNAKFNLDATTDRGDITNDFDSKLSSDDRGRGARLTGNLGGPDVRVRTNRGDVTLRKIVAGEIGSTEDGVPKTPKMKVRPPAAPAPPAPPRTTN